MKRLLLSFFMLLTVFSSTACGLNHNQVRSLQELRGGSHIQYFGQTYKTDPLAMEGRLNSLSGVGKASVVVYGDSIFIGFRRDPNYRGSNDALSRKIYRSLISDARHNQLYMVDKEPLVSRIEGISQRIHSGRQVTRNELQTLMNDVGLVVRPVNLIEKT